MLPQAVADIVDNSLSAGATRVDVDLGFDGPDSWLRISDNGRGMDLATLTEAFRYGSRRQYTRDDLGRFGFGLKTASTSQCRRVTVASCRRAGGPVEVGQLDLDHVDETDRWEIYLLPEADRPAELVAPLAAQSGTVVLWDRLDRVLTYNDPWGEWARRRLLRSAEDIEEHLGMVFHRFLAGQAGRGPLQIHVNGRPVEPWDPFCRSEPGTDPLQVESLEVPAEQGAGIVLVRPYVLPAQQEFSSEAAWKRASGPRRWNRQQGFYVYRANRMIQSGGWCRMRTTDEHTKLARVALEFFPELDSAFGLNIVKATVSLPPRLREQLEPLVTRVANSADARYRTATSRRTPAPARGPAPVPSRAAPPAALLRGDGPDDPIPPGRNGSGPGVSGAGGHRAAWTAPEQTEPEPPRARTALERAAARVGEASALERIAASLRSTDPEVAHDLGW